MFALGGGSLEGAAKLKAGRFVDIHFNRLFAPSYCRFGAYSLPREVLLTQINKHLAGS